MWGIFSISSWIHLQGWLAGSGPSGLDEDWIADDWTLGLAPPMGVELCLGPSSWSGHDVSTGPVVVGVEMAYHLMASPPDRKRVTPVGKVGSLPNSSSRLNLTCFLGFSSARMGALLCHPLLLNFQVLACSFKSCIWRHSGSLGGPDLGGLGDDEGLWYHLDLLPPLNWECHFNNSDHPAGESSLSHLVASLACCSAEGE